MACWLLRELQTQCTLYGCCHGAVFSLPTKPHVHFRSVSLSLVLLCDVSGVGHSLWGMDNVKALLSKHSLFPPFLEYTG